MVPLVDGPWIAHQLIERACTLWAITSHRMDL
jgi:hypothetical protein